MVVMERGKGEKVDLGLEVLVMVGVVKEEEMVIRLREEETEKVEVVRVGEDWEKGAAETEAEGLGWVRGRGVLGLVGLGRGDLGLVEAD